MPRDHNYEDDDDDNYPRFLRGMEAGNRSQTRFTRIPDAHLNRETVAGIRDMNLGRMRADGTRTGAPTIRFDTGRNSGVDPHININPRGRPRASDPHIQVSEGVVTGAQVVNKTLRYASIGLTVAAVAIDAWRLGSAFKNDIYIRDHAKEIIRELEDAIEELEELRSAERSSARRREIRETIEHLTKIVNDVKRTKKVPVKTIKTGSSIAGGWAAGAAGGYGGALAGAQAGAAIGTCFGPVGTVVGAPVGALVGALGGGIGGGMLGSYCGEKVAEKGLETFVDT